MRIEVSSNELEQGELSNDHLEQAINNIRVEGYTILGNIVSTDHLDFLHQKMTDDSHSIISANAERWSGRLQIGQLQQGPPPFAPYLFTDIVSNPIVEHLSITLLGKGAFNGFYNGNTNAPGSTQQGLHMDAGHLWPNLNPSHPTVSVVVNIPTIEVTEAEGAIQLWPGTHLIGDVSRGLDTETEEQFTYGPSEIYEGLEMLKKADKLIGHNILGFDIPVIKNLQTDRPEPIWEHCKSEV